MATTKLPTSDQFPIIPFDTIDSEPTDDELQAIEPFADACLADADVPLTIIDRCQCCDKIRELTDGVCRGCAPAEWWEHLLTPPRPEELAA